MVFISRKVSLIIFVAVASVGFAQNAEQMKHYVTNVVHNSPKLLSAYGFARTTLHKYVIPSGEFGATEILPGKLYLGNIFDSHNREALDKRNITSILTIATNVQPSWPESYNYLSLEASDVESESVLPSYFSQSNEFIHNIVSSPTNDAILVHCMQGRSRSVTLVVAYLMKHHGYTADDAMTRVRSLRPIAGPNDGFQAQLRKYEVELKEEKNN